MVDSGLKMLSLSHLPRQDNYFDCGLFVLTSVEFFCHAAPQEIPHSALANLNTKKCE